MPPGAFPWRPERCTGTHTHKSARHMAEDVRAFMNAMGLPAAVVVGHSMGASVAQQLAIDHPSRVAGLVLPASSPRTAPASAMARSRRASSQSPTPES